MLATKESVKDGVHATPGEYDSIQTIWHTDPAVMQPTMAALCRRSLRTIRVFL